MAVYEILDGDNNVINRLRVDADFVAANYDNYRLVAPRAPDQNALERSWRNSELERTDIIAQTPDFPDRDDWMAYRTTLRNWPSTSSFPETRPTSPDYVAPEESTPPE